MCANTIFVFPANNPLKMDIFTYDAKDDSPPIQQTRNLECFILNEYLDIINSPQKLRLSPSNPTDEDIIHIYESDDEILLLKVNLFSLIYGHEDSVVKLFVAKGKLPEDIKHSWITQCDFDSVTVVMNSGESWWRLKNDLFTGVKERVAQGKADPLISIRIFALRLSERNEIGIFNPITE
jgi:hypothetical protein